MGWRTPRGLASACLNGVWRGGRCGRGAAACCAQYKIRTHERNAQAEAMVARVAAKLEGMAPSGSKGGKAAAAARAPLSVPDDVEVLLRQATSLDKLCQMYEGWMAWI